MKKLAVLLLAVIMLMGCNLNNREVARIIVRPYSSDSRIYLSIYDNGRSDETAEFTVEDNEIYLGSYKTFDSDIINGEIINRLVSTELSDIDGEVIEPDTKMIKLMELAAEEIEHDIFDFKIIKNNDDYFAAVQLNVNWHDPCELYYLDSVNDCLQKIWQGEEMEILGVEVAY